MLLPFLVASLVSSSCDSSTLTSYLFSNTRGNEFSPLPSLSPHLPLQQPSSPSASLMMPSSASCDVRSLVWRCFWRNNNKKISTEVKGECFLSKPSHSTLSLSICLLLYSVGIDTLLSLWSLLGLALFPSCPLCMLYVPFSSSSKVQGMLRSSFLVLSSFSVASSRLSVEVLSLSLLDPDVAFSSFFCAFISRLNFDSLSSLDCVFPFFLFIPLLIRFSSSSETCLPLL